MDHRIQRLLNRRRKIFRSKIVPVMTMSRDNVKQQRPIREEVEFERPIAEDLKFISIRNLGAR